MQCVWTCEGNGHYHNVRCNKRYRSRHVVSDVVGSLTTQLIIKPENPWLVQSGSTFTAIASIRHGVLRPGCPQGSITTIRTIGIVLATGPRKSLTMRQTSRRMLGRKEALQVAATGGRTCSSDGMMHQVHRCLYSSTIRSHHRDLDFLMTGGQGCADNSTAHCPGQTTDEYITEFTFWAWTRSVLLFATDPRNLTAVMREALFNSEVC